MTNTCTPHPKKGNHIKLTGAKKVKFREAVFKRDNYAWRQVVCFGCQQYAAC